MSHSGHDLATNRWTSSPAVVAQQYSRTKRVRIASSAIPPLQRMGPVIFRKSLNQAPPSRVLSPDPKPLGDIGTAISISPAHFSKPFLSPVKFSSATQLGLHARNETISDSEILHVDADSAVLSPQYESSRSTPSPPPLLFRLGGIVSGERNVFLGEKNQKSSHFSGQSNLFSK
jgi:hypothetical protein